MKIILLNQTFYPDVTATSQYLSEVAESLVQSGHEVTVVTGRNSYGEQGKSFAANEIWRGVKIIRVPSTRFGKKAKWHRALDFASFILSCSLHIMLLPRHDKVMALTTPPLISFVGAWRAKLWREKFCYWVMDFNPDEAVAAGWLRKEALAAKVLERMSRFSLGEASRIIALDRFMRDRILAKEIPSEKVVVIPPWSQDGNVHFDPSGRDRIRKQNGFGEKFVVMYSGNMTPVHPLDTLLEAAEQLRNDPSILFCFVGGGSEFARVKRWASEEGLTNVVCLPYQPLSELAASLSAADAHVVVMGSPFVGLVHPCKIYNILAVGAPVVYVGPAVSHVTEIFSGSATLHPSVFVRHGESKNLARRLETLRQNTRGIERSGSGELVEPYSKKGLLKKLISVLEEA